jgi:hypothetical protein
MMDGREKSDLAVVAMKPTNKAGKPAAEPVERRAGPRGKRTSKARAGLRTGQVCHRRWVAYGRPQGEGRRSSPRSSIILARRCCGRRSSLSSGMLPPGLMG